MSPHFNNEIITVAGVYYRGITPATPAFKQLTAGTVIFLDRDLANQHDPNAVKCIAADVLGEDIFLGYIPRGIAKRLAPILDRGSDYSCSISQTRSSTGSAIIVITLTTFPCPQLVTSPRMTDHDHPMRHAPVISDPQSPTGMRFVQHRDLDRWSRNYDEVPGIYTIWSKDHKIYIGQSSDVGARWRKHFSDLVTKTHHNEELQHDWTHNGGKFFRFDLLEAASTSELDALEKSYIKCTEIVFT